MDSLGLIVGVAVIVACGAIISLLLKMKEKMAVLESKNNDQLLGVMNRDQLMRLKFFSSKTRANDRLKRLVDEALALGRA